MHIFHNAAKDITRKIRHNWKAVKRDLGKSYLGTSLRIPHAKRCGGTEDKAKDNDPAGFPFVRIRHPVFNRQRKQKVQFNVRESRS